MTRRSIITIAISAALAIGVGIAVPKAIAAQHHSAATPPTQAAPPAATASEDPLAGAGPAGQGGSASSFIHVDFSGEFLGWAKQDKRTGEVIGDNMTKTNSTESMVKTWLVADFLRRSVEKGHKPTTAELAQAREAIQWSDDDAAQTLWEKNGGDDSIQRLISMCGLMDTTVYENWWSRTQMSPRDAIRLGNCIADGTAAGPQWTDWLVDEMKNVQGTTDSDDQYDTRGGGHWGIIDGVPVSVEPQVAIKNGWTEYGSTDTWHLNCLAFTNDWTMAVMMRYPSGLGLDYGANVCKSIAAQLIT